MVDRASPAQQRKALEVANLFVKMGIGFVPIPVSSSDEFEKLTAESMQKLADLEELVGAQGSDNQKGALSDGH